MGKWTRYLAGALLAPFGLSDIASTTCASGTLGDICRWTRQRLGASVTVRAAASRLPGSCCWC
jgi:hypothetical protein